MRQRRRQRGAIAGVLGALVFLTGMTLPGSAQWITCEGPDGPYRVRERVPCAEALQPADAARRFLESLLDVGTTATAVTLAAKLETEAVKACDTAAERGTMGPLYGVGRWGCDNGYAYRNFCQGYRLEKTVALDYGFSVLYQVTVATTGWDVSAFDTSSAVLLRSADGEVRIVVGLSLLSPTAGGSTAPEGYAEAARAPRRGEARTLMNEILVYCEAYKDSYCRELRLLAARLGQPAAAGAASTSIVLTVTADRHRPLSRTLDVKSDAVSLLSVAGTIVDDRGQPVEGALVRLEGSAASARTASDGTYRVSAFFSGSAPLARRADVTLSRASVDIAPETLAGGVKAIGLVADGVSQLTFTVAAHGVRADSLAVDPISLGSLASLSPASALSLDASGTGTFVYIAPRNLPPDEAKASVPVGAGAAARSIAAVSVPVTIRYVDLDGKPGTATVTVLVVRPPLLLVGGFWAGPGSWTSFADEARRRGLDVRLVGDGVTWAAGTDSLSAWAKDFARDVLDLQAVYAASGVKAERVDVIAHGIGGLVARSALATTPPSPVRRLAFVGTPHHGMDWVDQETAAGVVAWLASHPTGSAELRSTSDALRQLNRLESTGSHLPADVEVLNVVGRRAAASVGSQTGPATWPDDGVVSAPSAHLGGVAEVVVGGVVHGSGLSATGTPLTESPEVWSAIFAFLAEGAARTDDRVAGIELQRVSGQVFTRVDGVASTWARVSQIPSALEPGRAVRTGSGGAALLAVLHPSGTWGTISLDAESEILVRAGSPDGVSVHVVSGRVRFLALADGPGAREFDVTVGALDRTRPWYAQQPELRLVAARGDFVVHFDGTATVYALDEALTVQRSKTTGFAAARPMASSTGLRFGVPGVTDDEAVPARGWWTEGFWSELGPGFRYPSWLLGISLAVLGLAIAYRVRAKRVGEPRPRS